MLDYLKKILEQIQEMNSNVDEYKKLSPSGAMPNIAQINKAIELIENNDFDDAEKLLLEAEHNLSGNDLVYRTLGRLYERKLDFENVIKYLKKSLKLNPTKRDIIMRLGYAQLSSKKYEDAMETFERAVSLFPLDSEVFTARGMVLYRMDRLDDARADFVKAFALDAHNLNALFLCATIDVLTGEYVRAETRLSLLLKIAPNTMNLYEYAKLKRLKKEYGLAKEYANKSLATNKNFLPAYILLSEIYIDIEDYDNALSILKQAEEQNLLSANFYNALGNIFLYKCDYINAKNAFEAAKTYCDSWIYSVKSLICEILLSDSTSAFEEMIIAYTESHKCANDEENALKYFLLGVWNFSLKNYEIACLNLQKSINLNINYPAIFVVLLKGYMNLNQYQKAVENFEKALEICPKNYELNKLFVDYLIKNNDWEKVKFKSQKALKIFLDDVYFENALFISGFKLLTGENNDYNVKELIKLAEKLEKNSAFMYTEEKKVLLDRIRR